MSMSLRDQLLKAGLVSQEKVKQVESDARKKAHRNTKDRALAAAESVRKAEERRRREAEAQRKRERDQKLNQQREERRKRKEARARAVQLINGHRLNSADAEIRYNFCPDGRTIKSVRVTEEQQKRLGMGLIGIASLSKYDFALLSREVALKLSESYPDALLLLYAENDGSEEDDWWGDTNSDH